MEEMDRTELKEFRLVLITLAALTSFNARLKKLSAFLLIDKALLEPNSEACASLYLQKVYAPSQCSLAGARLREIYCLFPPVYALCFALNDYNGTGGTGRKNDPCYWIAGGHTAMEITPADEAISDVFHAVAAECENQILNVLSEFHFFTERMSAFYPNFSPPKTISSDMVGVTPSMQFSECLVRILQAGSRFFGGEVHFGTDPNKIVTAEYWIWPKSLKDDGPSQLRLPNFMTLRLREIGKPGFEIFSGGECTLKNFDRICDVIMHLAMGRQIKKRFADIFVEPGTPESDAAAGILLFRDELRVSIDYARIKAKTVCLFENCLVFARQKGHELINVHRVFLSDLLQVRYRFEQPGKGSGFLTIYWREHRPFNEQKASGARMFFNDLDVLKIWAAFLAINTSTEPAIGNFPYMWYPSWWNPFMFRDRITVQDLVAHLPIITGRSVMDAREKYGQRNGLPERIRRRSQRNRRGLSGYPFV